MATGTRPRRAGTTSAASSPARPRSPRGAPTDSTSSASGSAGTHGTRRGTALGSHRRPAGMTLAECLSRPPGTNDVTRRSVFGNLNRVRSHFPEAAATDAPTGAAPTGAQPSPTGQRNDRTNPALASVRMAAADEPAGTQRPGPNNTAPSKGQS